MNKEQEKLISVLGDNPSEEHLTKLFRGLVINSYQILDGTIRIQPTAAPECLEKKPGQPWILRKVEI